MLSCLADYRGFMARGKENSPRETAFAQWLTDTRLSHGLTMSGLAQKMGLTSHARISQLEKGDEPTPKMIRLIANALVSEDSSADAADRLYQEGMSLAFGIDGVTYEVDPDLQMIVEGWDGMTQTGKQHVKSAAELALELSREGSIGGKRAE